MADRYLKHLPSNVIYIYQSEYATRDDFIEVADLQGTPLADPLEGEFTVVQDVTIPPKKTRAKKAGLTVSDDDLDFDAALSADASKGL